MAKKSKTMAKESRNVAKKDEDFDEGQADDSTFDEPAEEDMDVYEEDQAEEMDSQDEIDELEEGFMQGYKKGGKTAKCANCGAVLGEDTIEKEIKDEVYSFCSEKCASKFNKKNENTSGRGSTRRH